jgi:hypothetical protein
MKKQKNTSLELKKLTIAKISASEMNTVKGEGITTITGPLTDHLISWFKICV